MRSSSRIARALFAATFALPLLAAAEPLGRYNVDPADVTVSGISSGAIMAVQMHVAYSGTFRGVAAFAGHPYYCGKGDLAIGMATCAQALTAEGTRVPELVAITRDWASRDLIDDPANLAAAKVYIFAGKLDQTVRPAASDAVRDYYLNFTAAANIVYNNTLDAGHGWISPMGKVLCPAQQSPYVNDCQIDPQQTFLTMFHGPLQARRSGALSGNFIPVDQNEFVPGGDAAAKSMDSTAWLYAPAACAQGEPCRLHVSYHGCGMGYSRIGDQFIRTANINEWADTNRMLVLYPQVIPTTGTNGLGCWDWWAYTGPDFAQRTGAQMLASKRMVDRVTSGHAPVAAPQGLRASGVGSRAAKLSWSVVAGATGYRLYRNDTAVTVQPIGDDSYRDRDLIPATTYTYTVRAVAANGNVGPRSAPVVVTTD